MFELETIKKEYGELLTQLSDPELISNPQKLKELINKKELLETVLSQEKELQDLKEKIEENQVIISTESDPELVVLAESELSQLRDRVKNLEKNIRDLIEKAKQKAKTAQSVIIEIRAGTGGKEAALFAADLFKMYSKFAQTQEWKQKILDSSQTELGGLKEIILELSGIGAFHKMRGEAGVHRVQRIPETEKTGRIHTSTATVAVLLKPEKARLKIRPEELKIDVYRASGPGGQNVNKRETAVRITHLPTGIAVSSQTERNQAQNKENAMAILGAKLLEREIELEEAKTGGARRSQIGKAKRAEKIRTYNFPQDRITDHRIKKSWSNIEEIMQGKLDKLISEISKEEKLI